MESNRKQVKSGSEWDWDWIGKETLLDWRKRPIDKGNETSDLVATTYFSLFLFRSLMDSGGPSAFGRPLLKIPFVD